MAAYAAAVSLMHIIDLIKNHPSPPISLDKQQLVSLTEIVTFLQEFLEGYVSPFSYSDEADPLEMRIAEAVYAAEDVIESYIVDTIHLTAATTAQDDDDDDDDDDYDLPENINFFEEFLEGYKSPAAYSDEADPLEMRIADAAYAAEDMIESYIVDNIELAAASTAQDDDDDGGGDDDDVLESYTLDSIQLASAETHHEDEQIRYFNFYEGLQKVIEAMGLIKKEAMEMEMMREKGGLLEAELQTNVSVDASFRSSSIESKSEMVGFDDVRLQLLYRLTGGDSNLQIIPIVGMGGIGKTTLARNVFADQLIKEHFDICMWATISLDYNIEQTLREVLSQEREHLGGGKSVAELGEELHKCLFARRYLVVLDDMWSMEVWDKMRNFFPECNQRSRIIVTTRMSNLASHLTNSSNSLCLSFLNEVDSWNLFSKTVFGIDSEGCVPELREIGEKIVGRCKGLPLSIAVIGGLLAKSERTQGYWKYIEKNLSSIVNSEDDEYCLRVLKLSYNHLPVYLKPCFLYMGVFDEDQEIKVSTIINLWVSEGFVKPGKKKQDLERVAREYLQELVDRNLLLSHESKFDNYGWVCELESVGNNIKWCKMHDLVRDVSLREARKQRFYYVYNKLHNHHPSSQRRIVIPKKHSQRRIVIPKKHRGIDAPEIMLESSAHPRSYIGHVDHARLFSGFKLLRTLNTYREIRIGRQYKHSQKDVFELVNVRLLRIAVKQDRQGNNVLCSSISRLWSLHTLLVHSKHELEGPVEFWNMHQLKHVEFTCSEGPLRLQLPPNNDNNIVIMENLQTLVGMKDFHLNEDVVRRIPNLKILDVHYGDVLLNRKARHCLSYLQRLNKLESFRCTILEHGHQILHRICFPQSLRQIILHAGYFCHIEWEDVLHKIGRLPLVEELMIGGGLLKSYNWETIEGQFPRLKKLELMSCRLKKWTVSKASHFPLLQKLILKSLRALEEIPTEIGEIETLESIEMSFCSMSAVVSAKKMVEEQEELYGEEELSFRVLVKNYYDEEAPQSLASPNFQVELSKY